MIFAVSDSAGMKSLVMGGLGRQPEIRQQFYCPESVSALRMLRMRTRMVVVHIGYGWVKEKALS